MSVSRACMFVLATLCCLADGSPYVPFRQTIIGDAVVVDAPSSSNIPFPGTTGTGSQAVPSQDSSSSTGDCHYRAYYYPSSSSYSSYQQPTHSSYTYNRYQPSRDYGYYSGTYYDYQPVRNYYTNNGYNTNRYQYPTRDYYSSGYRSYAAVAAEESPSTSSQYSVRQNDKQLDSEQYQSSYRTSAGSGGDDEPSLSSSRYYSRTVGEDGNSTDELDQKEVEPIYESFTVQQGDRVIMGYRQVQSSTMALPATYAPELAREQLMTTQQPDNFLPEE